MYMIIDTETNGLPITKKYCEYPSYNDLEKYDSARIVQFTFMLCDNNLTELNLHDYIIYAESFNINNSEFHNITDEISRNDGYNFNTIADIFYKELKKCNYVIAHNIGFDINVIKSELYRRKLYHIIMELDKKIEICTMKTFKYVVKAKNKFNKIKDPSLKELYEYALKSKMENAHNSKYDVINLHKALKNITNGKLENFIENKK
jgi:DNA polymerase III subunit alpha